MAAAYLCCLTADGGVPLFCKTKGDLKQLPYALVGSLNGVDMFALNNDITLHASHTQDSQVFWKVFHDSIRLILVTQDDNTNGHHVRRILHYIFNCLVLLHGIEELTSIRNVERLKKEMKICNSVVDILLEQSNLPLFCDVTNSVDMTAFPESGVLQGCLDAFAEASDSPYGCLFVQGRIVVATKRWWTLSNTELIILTLFLYSLPKATLRDIPIYLPDASPKIPHRLLTFSIINGVEVCLICGPTPPLTTVEREVPRFWRVAFDALKTLSLATPRNFPPSIVFDRSILGFILKHTTLHRCLCTTQPREEDSRRKSMGKHFNAKQRQEILRGFYKSVTSSLFVSKDEQKNMEIYDNLCDPLLHQPLETYVAADYYKCYALQESNLQIFIMFNIDIPTFAMRSVTQKTLELLKKDKSVTSCWEQ